MTRNRMTAFYQKKSRPKKKDQISASMEVIMMQTEVLKYVPTYICIIFDFVLRNLSLKSLRQ